MAPNGRTEATGVCTDSAQRRSPGAGGGRAGVKKGRGAAEDGALLLGSRRLLGRMDARKRATGGRSGPGTVLVEQLAIGRPMARKQRQHPALRICGAMDVPCRAVHDLVHPHECRRQPQSQRQRPWQPARTARRQGACSGALVTGMPRHGTAMRGQKTADVTCAPVGASINFARSGFSGRGACRSACRAPGPCRPATALSGRSKSPCPRPDIGPRPDAQPPWLCGARYRLAPAFPCVHLGPWRRPGHGPSEAPTDTVQQTGK